MRKLLMHWQIHSCMRIKPQQKKEKGTDEKADTQLSEKKTLKNDVKKGTDELAFNKHKINKILRKGLNQFEGSQACA